MGRHFEKVKKGKEEQESCSVAEVKLNRVLWTRFLDV